MNEELSAILRLRECLIVVGMSTTVRYNYRLRPGVQAERVLLADWGRTRWLWNELVAAKKDRSRRLLKGTDLTAARAANSWLREGGQDPQSAVIYNFKPKTARQIKKKHSLPSIAYSANGFSIREGRLRLAKCPAIPVVWHRELPNEPSSVRVYRDSLGHWYASFVVEVEDEQLPATGNSVGIDWGVSTIATASDPAYDLESPVYGLKAAKELAKYQRRMARRAPSRGQAGSRRYKHAKLQTARTHKKVARQRLHTTRVWAKKVVANNDVIAVEDFKPKFLTKSTMARKAADNAIGITKTELISRAERAGRIVVIVPPAYTTMTCSSCGTRAKNRLSLSERTFVCESCGLIEGRDRNAARVILAQGETLLASAETVRQGSLPSGELDLAS